MTQQCEGGGVGGPFLRVAQNTSFYESVSTILSPIVDLKRNCMNHMSTNEPHNTTKIFKFLTKCILLFVVLVVTYQPNQQSSVLIFSDLKLFALHIR